jgi:hypothetical protein
MRRGAWGLVEWNSQTSHAALTSLAGSQVLSDRPYPFQCIRYSRWLYYSLLSRIFSTSNSLYPSWIIGGGGRGIGRLRISSAENGQSNEMLNTGCVLPNEEGNSSL